MVSAGVGGGRVRQLGQNFLVDRNILDVIERLAGVTGTDVVLEVGAGEGVLTQRLAASASRVHVIEIDERLAEVLTGALTEFDNVDIVWGDALKVDLGALDPAPTRMVANLPYGIAATLILRTIDELPTVDDWVVMVQKEVGERFAAVAGSPAYGVPSVLAQLACEVRVLRPISRNVFRPVPNVDSVLLGLTRRKGLQRTPAAVRTVVHGAFAHRRKALAGSLALSLPRQDPDPTHPGVRERARAVLVELGHPADARAETLAPDEFRALADAL